MRQKPKTTPIWVWYVLAIAAVLLAAPNGTIIKTVTELVDPLWVNSMRFSIIAITMLPFVLRAIPAMTKHNVKYALAAGVCYGVAVMSYVTAISLSQASYVAVIDLGIPIALILYSVYLTRERVSQRAVVGISIAVLGAFVVVGVPLMAQQGFESNFYPVATVLALVNVLAFPLAIIFSRKANEHGLSLGATFGLSSVVVVFVNTLAAVLMVRKIEMDVMLSQPGILWAVIYSALAVSLLARLLTVASYRHLGSATIAGLHYVEAFLAILIPIVLLSENMTREMVVGGLLILVGVIVVESHHHPKVHGHRRSGHRHV